jgi:hypothetical protein
MASLNETSEFFRGHKRPHRAPISLKVDLCTNSHFPQEETVLIGNLSEVLYNDWRLSRAGAEDPLKLTKYRFGQRSGDDSINEKASFTIVAQFCVVYKCAADEKCCRDPFSVENRGYQIITLPEPIVEGK